MDAVAVTGGREKKSYVGGTGQMGAFHHRHCQHKLYDNCWRHHTLKQKE